jgi:hypothetical protein
VRLAQLILSACVALDNLLWPGKIWMKLAILLPSGTLLASLNFFLITNDLFTLSCP